MSTAVLPTRTFVSVRKKNELSSNLTELNAADQVEGGFMTHNDWMAHCARYGHVAKYLARLMTSYDVRLLDVGCGYLNLPKWLGKNRVKVGEYWGIDLRAQPEWLEKVTWKVPMHVAQADVVLDKHALLGQPSWPAIFDVVTCFETFEHVPRSEAPVLARNLFEWTRPGGICFFSTPNAGVSRSTAGNHIGPDGVSREWTYQDKINLMKSVGFDVEATFGTFCGITRLPPEAFQDPVIQAAHRFLHHSWFTVLVAAAYPAESNNSMFVMRRPIGPDDLVKPMPGGGWSARDAGPEEQEDGE